MSEQRGDRTGLDRRLNLLAGPQYRIGTHTVTFAHRVREEEPIMADLFVEIDGQPVKLYDLIPDAIVIHIFLSPY